ncbi:hypothetical protein B0H13DRAFT_1858860 [Mycena leptocephala]|nr:hypothetical protein B0H13DRAFT_1858860 [Mycena leptocephala]
MRITAAFSLLFASAGLVRAIDNFLLYNLPPGVTVDQFTDVFNNTCTIWPAAIADDLTFFAAQVALPVNNNFPNDMAEWNRFRPVRGHRGSNVGGHSRRMRLDAPDCTRENRRVVLSLVKVVRSLSIINPLLHPDVSSVVQPLEISEEHEHSNLVPSDWLEDMKRHLK